MNEAFYSHGRRVLLVEDESLVSMLAEDILEQAGYKVTLAMRLDEGIRLASSADLDLAILDVNLGGDESYPIATILEHRRVPFLFASGYAQEGLARQFRNYRIVDKPYEPEALLRAAAQTMGSG